MARLFWNDAVEWWVVCDRCYDHLSPQQWGGHTGERLSPEQKQQIREKAEAELQEVNLRPKSQCGECGHTMTRGVAAVAIPTPGGILRHSQGFSLYECRNGLHWTEVVEADRYACVIDSLEDAIGLCRQIPGLFVFPSYFRPQPSAPGRFTHEAIDTYWRVRRAREEEVRKRVAAIVPGVEYELDEIPF